MSLRSQLQRDGYVILKAAFTAREISDCQEEVQQYVASNKTMGNAGGISIPDFVKKPALAQTAGLKSKDKIQAALKDIFNGDDFRFCSHNDIGINRVVGWHKDKLNGPVAKYETVDIWSEHGADRHEIVKVLVYLENHGADTDGLKVVPGSHLTSKIDGRGHVQLTPELGDAVLFDQRITHRGMEKQVQYPRILISFGFGKNNIFTDNFEKGTVIRQNRQNGIT